MVTTDQAANLLSLCDALPDRGFSASKPQAAAVLEMADNLALDDPSERVGGWLNAEDTLCGNWRLCYTSSPAFVANGGLTGFTKVQGVTTPELLMQIGQSTSGSQLNFFEPLAPDSASLVARHLGLPGNEPLPECVVAQGFWSCGTADQLKVTLQRVVVGSYEYTPGNTGAESVWTAAAPGLIGHGGATGAWCWEEVGCARCARALRTPAG